ncbi:MAG: hypothetical protein AB7F99_04810 [Vicinamibacterales bacterium]
MGRIDVEDAEARGLARVFVAATIAEARKAEECLTERGVDYAVQAEALSRTLFGSLRYWAAFYVDPSEARSCAAVLSAAGLEMGVVIDEETET